MPILNKTKRTAAIYNRGREVVKVYDHGTLAWQKSTSIPDYLCFTALEAGTFTLTIPAAVTPTYLSYVEYSLDGINWTRLTVDSTDQTITTPTIAQGGKVYWRGSGNSTAMGVTVGTQNSQFSSSARFDVSGNIMSMLFADDFEGQLVLPNVRYSFTALFRNCNKLVSAENLLLPAMTLRAECYRNLFLSCSNLVKGIKVLPAMQLMPNCYLQMYGACTSLVEGTEIPATTAVSLCCYGMYSGCSSLTIPKPILFTNTAYNCCYQMYRFCTSLEVAPDLTQATLADNCFRQMFKGCTKLKYIKCLATNISATQCLLEWCDGVSSTGTFIQAEGVEWPRGASGIPTGWLAYDEGEEIPNDYTPCDYIYNSQTANGGVDLGFKFRILDYSAEAKFKQDDISNGMVIGTKISDSGAIWWYNYISGKSFRINACSSSGWKYNVNGFAPLDTNTHIIRYVGDTDGCYQFSDGTQSGIHDISTWAADESTDNLFVFGRSETFNTYKGRIYYLKVWNTATEEVICNLIPCSRNSDGAAGFWDTAQKQFFTSTYWTAHFDNE